MWANVIVLSEPVIDDRLCLSGCCEPFSIEDFSA